jgi:hypothetical protein
MATKLMLIMTIALLEPAVERNERSQSENACWIVTGPNAWRRSRLFQPSSAAPARTPAAIIARFDREMTAVLTMPEVQANPCWSKILRPSRAR